MTTAIILLQLVIVVALIFKGAQVGGIAYSYSCSSLCTKSHWQGA